MIEKTEVVVTDIDIKFTSMVALMVKAALAAIPALMILAFIGFVVAAVFTVLFSGYQ